MTLSQGQSEDIEELQESIITFLASKDDLILSTCHPEKPTDQS